jgi:hypothetical protein
MGRIVTIIRDDPCYSCPGIFFGKRTVRVKNRTSHITPAIPESNPAITVNARELMNFSDQPATPVERLQINISAARSVVDNAWQDARIRYRTFIRRERFAIFFTYGVPNHYTVEYAKNNMLIQLALMPGTKPTLPPALKERMLESGVQLAEDKFTLPTVVPDIATIRRGGYAMQY